MRIFFDSVAFEARALFFDKDGTLVDLHHQYATLMDKRVEKILARYPKEGEELRRGLCRAVGYDPDSRKIAPIGPLAVTTREQTLQVVADFLLQRSVPLERAKNIARESFDLADLELRLDVLIRPMEGLYPLLQVLQGKNALIACLTNDEHRRAQAVLEFLRVADFFHLILGGDEVSRPKPDPEMVAKACEQLNIPARRIAYIGDTVADMKMAKKAGAGLAVGVLGGAADRPLLSAEADVVIPNLSAISISPN